MPNMDMTGPEGKGPMTGRGLGRCKKETEYNKSKSNDIIKKIINK